MRAARKVTCRCGQIFITKSTRKTRCDGCQYRHELAEQRRYYQQHKDEILATRERWVKENPDKAAESARLSARRSYRRNRKDPMKVKQMQKYHREYKRFFPERFNIKNEVVIRGKMEIVELGEIRAV